jgi:hypothetical protein
VGDEEDNSDNWFKLSFSLSVEKKGSPGFLSLSECNQTPFSLTLALSLIRFALFKALSPQPTQPVCK